MFPAIEDLPEFAGAIDSRRLQRGHRHYNAGLARWRGRLLMAYRYQRYDGFNHIGIAELEDDFTVIRDQAVEFPDTGRPYHLEDPRLVVVGDRLFINFDQIDYSPPWEKCLFVMRLFELDEELRPLREVPLPFGKNGKKTEKNWIWFDAGGELRFVHSLAPQHLVVDCGSGRSESSAGVARWHYGTLSGRTPAIRIGADGDFLAIVGGHIPHAGRRSLYWVGAITFSAEWPHRLTGITPHPIAWASAQSATIYNPQNGAWHPIVLFPCGLVPDGDSVLVSAGINDSSIALLRYNVAALLEKMVSPSLAADAPRISPAACAVTPGTVLVRVKPKPNGRPRTIAEPGGSYRTGDTFVTTAARAVALAEFVEVVQ